MDQNKEKTSYKHVSYETYVLGYHRLNIDTFHNNSHFRQQDQSFQDDGVLPPLSNSYSTLANVTEVFKSPYFSYSVVMIQVIRCPTLLEYIQTIGSSCFYVFCYYHILSYSLGSFFFKIWLKFMYLYWKRLCILLVVYVFLLFSMYCYCCLCIVIVSLCTLIVVNELPMYSQTRLP